MRTHVRHTLLAWVLWQSLSNVTPTWTPQTPLIQETFETQQACGVRARYWRAQRGVILNGHDNTPLIPVWACLPAGAPPERASFE